MYLSLFSDKGGRSFSLSPFPSYEIGGQSGPDRSRAQLVGAAKRTLDGEDLSGSLGLRERGVQVGLLPTTKPEFPR